MPNRLIARALLIAVLATPAAAQQPLVAPEPLPPSDAAAPAPPGAAAPGLTAPDLSAPAAAPAPEPPGRVFCGQNVTYRLADAATVPPTFRPFVGIWSDANWTPQLCAALIVESIQGDGTATLTYAYGPQASGPRVPAGGVLHGTGIVRDGQLLFQNNDGSQFVFKPYFIDLQGQLTTPQGQTYQAVFKKTY
jgi:hypothetical protein